MRDLSKLKLNCLAIGSLPHNNINKAMALVEDCFLNVPFWPQLTKINKNEDMIIQFLEKMPSFFIGKEKDFIELLNLIGEVGIESVERSIEVIRKITPTSVTLDKIKFICQRNDEEDYYKQYFENDSSIVNNSINLLNNYAELLSERKDGMS